MKKMQKIIPILDNGHGRETPGKRSPVWPDGRQLFEYEFNRDIVRRIAQKLNAADMEYRILVPESVDVSLAARCKRANTMNYYYNKRCILVSIHANAGGGTGFEIYTTRGNTKADDVAATIYQYMKAEFEPDGWKMRADFSDGDPDKESQFYILKHTVCPAVLTENFFMDNPKDCAALFTDEFRDRIAQAHFAALKHICLTH